MQFLLAFFLSLAVSWAAWRLGSLSLSGALAATLSGAIILGLGGWQWALLLLAFFLTSSALSRAFKARKRGLNEKFAKGSQRDAGQVFGNGGLAVFLALIWGLGWQTAWVWLAFAASLAAVNADTWATELGVLNPGPPRLLLGLKPAEKGASGAVSPTGTLASLAGAALIGFLAWLIAPLPLPAFAWLWITLAGLAGSLFDSLLGATLQAIYFCPQCQKETEHSPRHTCGASTHLWRGLPWLNNDLVNLACALFAAALMLGVR